MTPKIYIPTIEEDAAITAAAESDPDALPLSDEELHALEKAVPEEQLHGYVAGLKRATLEAEWAAQGARRRDGRQTENAAAALDRLVARLRKIAADAAQ